MQISRSAEERALQTLIGKQAELQESRLSEQKLEKKVQHLNLKVLEEQLMWVI